jgi:RHS repeat-associated protein
MVSGATSDTTYYMGAFEYKNDRLNQVFTEEGRIRYDDANDAYNYDYYLKDHLGNIRVVFTGDGNGNAEVLQVNNYYPFGMRFNQAPEKQSQSNDYLYNGKELQKFGLNWYDYGARMYDAALGRFISIDPIADNFAHVSPYNYAENEPVGSIDLWGLQRVSVADDYWSHLEQESKNRWRFLGDSSSTANTTMPYAHNSGGNKMQEETESAARVDGGSDMGSKIGGSSASISGAYATPYGGLGFSFGYFQGLKDGGFYFTAKKGEGVMMSLSIDGSYYINNETDYLRFNELYDVGESYDAGYSYLGASLSGATNINGTPYYQFTASGSPVPPAGLDYGAAQWNTFTTPLIIDGSFSPVNAIINIQLISNAYKLINTQQ